MPTRASQPAIEKARNVTKSEMLAAVAAGMAIEKRPDGTVRFVPVETVERGDNGKAERDTAEEVTF